MSSVKRDVPVMVEREVWQAWPVYWTAVWVGALAAIAVALIFGLIGIAIGAHTLDTAGQIMKWSEVGRGTVAWTILGAFLSFVAGGWATASVAGIRRAEPAILHGAIAWLVALPLLTVLLGLGAGTALGGWYGGIVGAPVWVAPAKIAADPQAAAAVARNAALAGVTAILLGLIGSVIGAWLGSGERMSLVAARASSMPRRHH